MKEFYQKIIDDVPKLKRNKVWCHKCGLEKDVDSAQCLAKGWPKHCGETMSIDKPRKKIK